ncbi:MAG: phosphoribosylformylglycinamidine cyclo-ligase [Ignavibacteriaceae bacterium]
MADKYKQAGVNIHAGNSTVKKIKQLARSTFSERVLSDIGLFGAFFKADFTGFEEPVLVSSVDGVGTKLKIAFLMNRHDTIGQDLVNHCVNDIAVCGAEPLFFMDYMAFGKLEVDTAVSVVNGFATACKENSCALIGGETAEMPGIYQEGEYDISGTIVGVVERKNILDGKSVQAGDLLIGFKSNGLHTNGYSLARRVLLDKYNLADNYGPLEFTLGEELLRVHKSYLKLIKNLKRICGVKAFSHITGGGIIGNTLRVIPDKMKLEINWSAWEVPAIFRMIQEAGEISDPEMREVFNLGIGLVVIVSEEASAKVIETAKCSGEDSFIIGKVII